MLLDAVWPGRTLLHQPLIFTAIPKTWFCISNILFRAGKKVTFLVLCVCVCAGSQTGNAKQYSRRWGSKVIKPVLCSKQAKCVLQIQLTCKLSSGSREEPMQQQSATYWWSLFNIIIIWYVISRIIILTRSKREWEEDILSAHLLNEYIEWRIYTKCTLIQVIIYSYIRARVASIRMDALRIRIYEWCLKSRTYFYVLPLSIIRCNSKCDNATYQTCQ